MNKAVIYARFSSYKQQEQSIDGQVRACKEYAKNNDLVVVKEYCDQAKSGTNTRRPEFQQMMHDAQLGLFDIILVYQYDRFSRNVRESLNCEFELKTVGVKLISIKEAIDENSSTSVIVKNFFNSIAEYYSIDLANKVTRGMKESLIQHKTIGGPRMFGYKTDPKDKKIIVDEYEANIVREIFNMRAAGTSLDEIINSLNSRGIKNINKPFKKTALNILLKRERYTGKFFNPFNRSEIIFGMYPEIINQELFDAVQETFNTYRINAAKQIKTPTNFYLSGKLFSAIDGTSFGGVSGYSKSGKKYSYYKASVNGIVIKYPKTILEDHIIDGIKKLVSTNTYMDYLSKEMTSEYNRMNSSSRAVEKRNRIIQLEKKMNHIAEAFIEANSEMRKQLNSQMTELHKEMNSLKEQDKWFEREKSKLLKNKNLVKEFLQDFFDKDFSIEENKAAFFDLLLNSVFVLENHVDIYLNFDIESKVTFIEYKNDTSKLEGVRLGSLMVDHYGPDTNTMPIRFFRNKVLIQFQTSIKITNAPLNS